MIALCRFNAIYHLLVLLSSLSETTSLMDEGKDFLLVFPETRNLTETDIMIYVYHRYTFDISGTMYFYTGSSMLGAVSNFDSYALTTSNIVTGTGISQRCVRIVLDQSSKVYVKMPSPGDFYMGMPTDAKSRTFYIVTYCEVPGSPCQTEVVAFQDYTSVDVYLTGALNDVAVEYGGKLYSNGDTISVLLMTREVLQLQSDTDLTGTRITSNSSVSVFSGSAGTTIQGPSSAMVVEQMPPVHQWGLEHVAAPTPDRNATGDYFRIVTCQNNTAVHVSGESPVILSTSGQWIQRNFTANSIKLIRSDKPVLVVRLTVSRRFDSEIGGPAMVVMVPTEQFVFGVDLFMPNAGKDYSALTVVTKRRFTAAMHANGVAISGWNQVADSAFYVAQVETPTSVAVNCVNSTTSKAVFVVYAYGREASRSNSFIGGRAYNEINPECVQSTMEFGDQTDNDCNGLVDEDTCTETNYTAKDCAQINSGTLDVFGTMFLLTFPRIHGSKLDYVYFLDLSSPDGGTVHVNLTTPLLTTATYDQSISFPSTGGHHVILHPDLVITENGLSNKTVLVTSDKRISAHVTGMTQENDNSVGGYRMLPVDTLGTHYFVATVCETNDCQMVVMAAYSNTVVRVRLRLASPAAAVVHDGVEYRHGDTIRVELARYQSVQIASRADMSGSEVEANKPVAVLSGGEKTKVGYVVYDQVVEQIIPVHALGTEYFVVQSPQRVNKGYAADMYVIVPTEDDTTVIVNSLPIVMEYSGQTHPFELNKDAKIQSNKPVMVFQVLKSCFTTCDAAIMMLPPVLQYKTHDILWLSLHTIYITVITENVSQTYINRNNVPVGGWEAIDNDPKWITASTNISKGIQLIINTKEFGTIAGFITTENKPSTASEAFPLAFNLQLINQYCVITDPGVGDGLDNDCDGFVDEENCTDPTSPDDDLDGMFNEDCMKLESSILISSSVSSSLAVHSSSDVTVSSDVSVIVTSASMYSDVSIQLSSSVPSSSDVIVSSDVNVIPTSSLQPAASSDVIIQSSSILSQPYITTSSPGDVIIQPTSSQPISDVYTTSLSASQALQPSTPSTTEACLCICNNFVSSMNSQSLALVVQSIQKELYVDKATVSHTLRKFISIPDSRPTATGIGYLGIGLISGLFLSIIILDLGTLVRDFKQLVHTLREAISGDNS